MLRDRLPKQDQRPFELTHALRCDYLLSPDQCADEESKTKVAAVPAGAAGEIQQKAEATSSGN
jgi:hypothetical protein